MRLPPNREIICFVCCEWVRETMLFLSPGRAAPTCPPAAAPAPSLVLIVDFNKGGGGSLLKLLILIREFSLY